MKLRLTEYGISEMKRRTPPIAVRGPHKIRLSENMSQEDLQLLSGPKGHKSAWVENVPEVTEEPAVTSNTPGTKFGSVNTQKNQAKKTDNGK